MNTENKKLNLSEERLAELQQMAERYCFLTHDDKPTISQKGLKLVILEALSYKLENPLVDSFYCADWYRCGTICLDQCPACEKAEAIPEVQPGSGAVMIKVCTGCGWRSDIPLRSGRHWLAALTVTMSI